MRLGALAGLIWLPPLVVFPLRCQEHLTTPSAILLGVGGMVVFALPSIIVESLRVRRAVRAALPALGRGAYTEACEILVERARALERLGPMRNELIFTLAWAELARGTPDAALRTFGLCFLYRRVAPSMHRDSAAMLSLLLAFKGELEAAEQWLHYARALPVAWTPLIDLAGAVLAGRQKRWGEMLERVLAAESLEKNGVPPVRRLPFLIRSLARDHLPTGPGEQTPLSVAPGLSSEPGLLALARGWPELASHHEEVEAF